MPEVTIENFKQVLEAEPELKNTILATYKADARKALEEEDGLIIRTKEDDEQYVQSHLNTRAEDEVNKRLKPLLDVEYGKSMHAIDEEVFKITGLKRNIDAREKTTDYIARVARELKSGDPVTVQKVRELEVLLDQNKQEAEKQLVAERQKFDRYQIESQVSEGLSERQFPIPPQLKTDDEKQRFIESQKRLLKNDFLSSYTHQKDSEGNIIFFKDGKPQLSSGNGKPKTAKTIFDEEYSYYFLQAGRQATGTGNGTGNSSNVQSTDFKNKDDIHKHLGQIGLDASSKEYRNKFEKLALEAGLEI